MADNTTIASNSGGDVIATDDIGGVKYQRVKLIQGADGTNDGDISSTNPLYTRLNGKAVAHGTNPTAVSADAVAPILTSLATVVGAARRV